MSRHNWRKRLYILETSDSCQKYVAMQETQTKKTRAY